MCSKQVSLPRQCLHTLHQQQHCPACPIKASFDKNRMSLGGDHLTETNWVYRSHRKLQGGSVSADGACFCSVLTELAHAVFLPPSAHYCWYWRRLQYRPNVTCVSKAQWNFYIKLYKVWIMSAAHPSLKSGNRILKFSYVDTWERSLTNRCQSRTSEAQNVHIGASP